MARRRFKLLRSSAGIDWSLEYDEDEQGATAVATQEIAPLLELNHAMATHNDGYTPSREMRRVASIPASVRLKWLTEEGWDCMSPDPDCQRKLAIKLDSNEYMYLRTAPGRMGDHWRHHI